MSESIKKKYPGFTAWENEQGQFHREDGPAVEWNDGSESWWVNGKHHRLDGPARIWTGVAVQWGVNGYNVCVY